MGLERDNDSWVRVAVVVAGIALLIGFRYVRASSEAKKLTPVEEACQLERVKLEQAVDDYERVISNRPPDPAVVVVSGPSMSDLRDEGLIVVEPRWHRVSIGSVEVTQQGRLAGC